MTRCKIQSPVMLRMKRMGLFTPPSLVKFDSMVSRVRMGSGIEIPMMLHVPELMKAASSTAFSTMAAALAVSCEHTQTTSSGGQFSSSQTEGVNFPMTVPGNTTSFIKSRGNFSPSKIWSHQVLVLAFKKLEVEEMVYSFLISPVRK